MSTAARRRWRPRLRVRRHPDRERRRLPRPGPRLLLALAVAVAVLVGGWFWVRQSSLVAVQRVSVSGVTGPDAAVIRSTLVQRAEQMTTLDASADGLKAAVARYGVVDGVSLRPHLPHGLTVVVSERIPVATIVASAGRTTVAADGRLLAGAHPGGPLPTITVATPATGLQVTGTTAAEVQLLAAAPYRLLAKIASAGDADGGRGLDVTLRDGPVVYFGDGSQLAEKWRAAVAVLASSASDGASYIDVSVPSRPAAGTGADTNPSASPSGAATTPATGDTGTATTPATGDTGAVTAGDTGTAAGDTGAADTGDTGAATDPDTVTSPSSAG